jgi:hypothetical protein
VRTHFRPMPDNKNQYKLINVILVSSFLLLFSPTGKAQDTSRFDYYIGYGFYEGFNIGGEYYFRSGKQSVSLSAGYDRLTGQENISLTFGYNLAFFRDRKDKSGRYRWHLNNKLAIWQLEDDYYLWRAVSIIPSINRRFNLYRNLSISFDAGPSFNFTLYERRKTFLEVGQLYRIMPDFRVLFIF